ncbi:hypothetical protein P7C73_g1046, partial [Tremellales sp. Uapishka_1]
MFAKSLIALAALAQVALGQLTIQTPASLIEVGQLLDLFSSSANPMHQCQPVLLSWSGGTGPYFVAVIPGGQSSAAALKDFGHQTGTSLTWTVDIASGTSVTVKVTDSTGTINYDQAVTIQAGSSTSCISSSVSIAPSGSASGATSVATAASSAASSSASSAAGASSAASSAQSSAASGASSASSAASTAASSAAAGVSSVKSAASSAASSAKYISITLLHAILADVCSRSAASSAVSAASSGVASASKSATASASASSGAAFASADLASTGLWAVAVGAMGMAWL